MGKPPHAHSKSLMHTIINEDVPQITGKWTDDFKDFVSKCLNRNPAKRLDIHEVLGHRFLVGLDKEETREFCKQAW